MRLLITGGNGFIGTNLLEMFLPRTPVLLNLDTQAPHVQEYAPFWRTCDILDGEAVDAAFADFQPSHVIHLAARTDVVGKTLDDYKVNTAGTANLLASVKKTPSVERLIVTSTQFVHRPGHLPTDDEDYEPHTLYGESKVITEQLTRSADLTCCWTLVRPTNIWGPWHPRYPQEFWRVLARGRYLHPAGAPVIRSYGYVKNVVHQYEQILAAPAELVNRQVYYVGDGDIDLYAWANGFSVAITGKTVYKTPRWVLRAIALVGDGVNLVGGNFPLFSSRYQSMVTDYSTPIDRTLQTFCPPPYTLQQGIDETVAWLQQEGLLAGHAYAKTPPGMVVT
jgi:nucleoside-diphosphate-sugar epimerase